jgi:hypothetical protein
MAQNKQQRRSAKKHQQSARLRAHIAQTDSPAGRGADPADLITLLHLGAHSAFGQRADEAVLDRVVDELMRPTNIVVAEATLSDQLVRLVGLLYEGGWQPLDVVHVVRRQAPTRLMRLLLDSIATQADLSHTETRAPEEWLDQLTMIGVRASPPCTAAEPIDPQVVECWRRAATIDIAAAFYEALLLLGVLLNLPRLSPIGPLPSQWTATRAAPQPAHRRTADAKVLARIRALLAKAEGTTFDAEAEAFTAKAQDLMTRHAIDATVLLTADHDDLRADVVVRRVHLDNPYAAEKVDLLAVVCRANGVRTVWHDTLGFATVVGLPVDLDMSELLFTSLLVQANRALGEASAGPARSRSRTFRRAFYVAYAHRIGERLTEAAERANDGAARQYGTALVPVLQARSVAVESEFARLFPKTRSLRGRRFDAQGWAAGHAAADRAVLDEGRGRLTS